MHFRKLWDDQDQMAAAKYFRRFVDDHRYGTPLQLRDVLGNEFDPSYEELLNIIPFEQFVNIDRNSLGSGARGSVYRATWKCPRKIDMIEDEERPVALKMIRGEHEESDAVFLREVSLTTSHLELSHLFQ
jgi:hypothetical protein